MKIKSTLNFFILFLISFSAFSQTDVKTVDMNEINRLKHEGKLNGKERYVNYDALKNRPQMRVAPSAQGNQVNTASGCNCWVPRDATWQVGQFDGSGGSGGPGVAPDYRNDDWSTVNLALPFHFCFYGRQVDSVFINNNGNVSIDNPYSTFTANSFPDPSFTMIAPFWGDVDTRAAGSGLVYYQMTATHLIIQWENVGYFGTHDDKLNTFQLIMTNGADPLLSPGTNVSFCYKDMQWTTGDASSGVGGFGGTPATVGVNQGNGIDYIQIGLFDQAGGTYDGPYGNNDGIDALDNQSFLLNVCQSGSNVPPILNSVQACDTVEVCEGDTIFMSGVFLSPEQGQTTTVTTASLMTGLSLVNTTPGNTTPFTVQIIGLPTNLGMNMFDLIGTDDGSPVRTTRVHVVVHVWPAAVANYSVSPSTSVSVGDVLTFNNTGTAGATYLWDFGDGSTDTTFSPTHSYSANGIYNATLTVTTPGGCTATYTQQIVVSMCSTAGMSVTNPCAGSPSTITFTGIAVPNATFNWSFSGGTVVSGSGGGPYTVIWNSPGNYQVDLSVDGNGCATSSTTQFVTVNPVPSATFTSDAQVCAGAPANINFTGSAPGGATYAWNFNGGNSSGSGSGPYTVSWNTAGNYTMELIVSANGCSDTTSNNITVNAIPTSVFNATPVVCTGSPITVNFTGVAGAGANYNWNFGGGTIVSGSGAGPYTLVYSSAGTNSISLTVDENGCTSMPSSQNVTNNPIPTASINATPALCVGASNSISFNGSATPAAVYTWSFGNGQIASGSGAGPYSVSWANAGPDVLSLVVSDNGCTDTTTFNVTVNAIPTANFTATPSVCAGEIVNISYTGSASATASYNWNFNGATINTGSGQGPYTVNWSSAGNYSLSLVVTENGCVSQQQNVPVTINAFPVASIAPPAAVCEGQAASISFNGTALPGATFNWTFTNGTVQSGSGAGPYNVTWNTAGSQALSLTVTQNGCSNSTNSSVTVNHIPTSTFVIPPSVCVNQPFNVSYSGDANGSANYTWNFNGATVVSGSGQGPYSVTYPGAGNLTISLVVDQLGCVSPPTANAITIAPLPVAYAGADASVCSGTNVNLGQQASAGNTYAWTPATWLNDPTTAQPVANAINNNSGEITTNYILTVTSSYGCINHDTVSVIAKAIPAPTLPPLNPLCENVAMAIFTPQGHVFDGVSYSWNFGAGATPSTSTNFMNTVTFTGIGKHVITLDCSFEGCQAPQVVDTIEILPIPVADFLPDITEGCAPLKVTFSNLSSLNSSAFVWSFGDGTNGVTGIPTHTYDQAGIYTVKLTSTTAGGCQDDTTKPKIINVYEVPEAAFTANPEVTTIYEPVVQFLNQTVHGETYQWSFGDTSATSNTVSPYHTYPEVGAYQIMLIANTSHNCRDTTYGVIRVEYGYSFYVPSAFTPNGDGVNDYFQGYGSFIQNYDMRIYDRWGIEVFHSDDYTKTWDGRVNNKDVQNDVYVYRFKITDMKSQVHTYIGKVTVLR